MHRKSRKELHRKIPQSKVKKYWLGWLVNLKSQRGIYYEVYYKKEQCLQSYDLSERA